MNQLSLLLLVAPDRKGLETLTYGFEREGCAVAGTQDPALAPELARTTTPQLAVISLHDSPNEPNQAALNLISDLRDQPQTRDLPVVTLGPATLRPAALAAGASDFLSTPLFIRDVISVGKLMLLIRGAMAGVGNDGEIELQARLSEYHSLYYLLRALSATNRSGILQLNRGNKKGELRFSEGATTSAQVGTLQAFPALHHLLLWEEAALSLKLRPVVRRSQFPMGAADLLEECERFLRDFTHAARELGSPRTLYVASNAPPVPGSKKVPAEAAPVLRLFDGRHTLSEVIEESPFRIFDTLRVIKRLLDAGGLSHQASSAIRDDADAEGMNLWLHRPVTPGPAPIAAAVTAPVATAIPAAPVSSVPPTRRSGAHAPLAAASRPTPARLAVVPDQRSSTGERRKSSRQRDLSSSGEAPARKTPAPIPLTVRKSASQPTTEGPVLTPRRLRTPPPIAAVITGDEPTIHQKLNAAFPVRATPLVDNEPAPLTAHLAATPPAVLVEEAPAPAPPVEAAPAPAPAARRTATPPPTPVAPPSKGPDTNRKNKKTSHSRLTPTSAFNAIESDFFAREADLYKRDAVESFDDLDRTGTARKLQPVQPARTAAGSNTRKKR